ncbi:MAG: glycoside hydrolase family 97 protein [Bacteroidales bacterium]|nr:glycoside hydrolase family 97 protein [Bacteroidales bacterium]
MKTRISWPFILILLCPFVMNAQKAKIYEVKSPNGAVVVKVEAGAKLQWSVQHKGQQLIMPSAISLVLQSGEVLGDNTRVSSVKPTSVNTRFNAINYRKSVIMDVYNQITLTCKGNYGVIFRVYDDAVAYRFFTGREGEMVIKNEEANFNFTGDQQAFVPIQWDYRDGKIFNTSFEALYREIKLSQFPKDSLAFLPLLVDVGQNKKVELFEADLEDYPGMYVDLNSTGKGFKGVFAPYPLETYVNGRNVIPGKRADYIAKTTGTRSFPWRAIVISEQDKDLLNCDIVQKLASPNRLADISWIKVGQVSWDWWNDLNVSHVDFRSGMNTPTYKYYIDFASANHIPYIILDEGWNSMGDLTKIKADLDLEELVEYGNQRGVGLILWAQWQHIMQQKEKAFPFFSKLGIKGLKIDFIDRDDQLAVTSLYEIAREAAGFHLLVDYHGVYKPTGLQRTYPNVVGIEGVKGMENVKWADEDVPRYDVTLPFIRNQAGPMDYTPGAMRNASKASFRAVNSMPMSKGTRVHQLAMYVVFDVPLQMLSDNPTAYRREQECTDFITKIPTTFEETVPVDGKVAEYVAIARKKGDTWFVGAMTNWSPRELTIDFSFLEPGEYRAEVFRDGINADRDATDYVKEVITLKSGDKLKVKLMDGGGWVARLEKTDK